MILICRRILIATILVGAVALSQPPRRGAQPSRISGPVSFEAIPFFSNDSASGIVNIHYRIKQDFFVIQRNLETPEQSAFLGKGELIVEVRNEGGNSVAREIRPIVLHQQSMPSGQPLPDLQGAFSLRVPPGKYSIWFNVDDRQSERSYVSKNRSVVVPGPTTSTDIVSEPIFVQPPLGVPRFVVLNQGSQVPFGDRGGCLFAARISDRDSFRVHYRLILKPEYKQLSADTFEGDSVSILRGLPALVPVPNNGTNTSVAPIEYRLKTDSLWSAVYLPLPLEKLQPGQARLLLDISSGGKQQHKEYAFHVFWADQPKSLANLELALDALQHIATDQEMEILHSFSGERFVQAFMNFWKKKDPDTTTAYNEVMAEYYRRVDVANRRFSSDRELDGYKTDRGRIYILYGAPTKTERVFSPDHPAREVWTYVTLKKRFVFEVQNRTGAFVLVSLENL